MTNQTKGNTYETTKMLKAKFSKKIFCKLNFNRSMRKSDQNLSKLLGLDYIYASPKYGFSKLSESSTQCLFKIEQKILYQEQGNA